MKTPLGFTLSPDQKGIETMVRRDGDAYVSFTLSPDQKGIETVSHGTTYSPTIVHTEPRSKGD